MVTGNDLVELLKLHTLFKITKVGDSEQMLQDWTKYAKQFKHFLCKMKVARDHTLFIAIEKNIPYNNIRNKFKE